MSQSSPISTDASNLDVSHSKEAIARFLAIAKGYWTGEKRMEAWRLTAAVLVLVLLTLGVQIGINRWNRLFFDALDHRNGLALWNAAIAIAGLAFVAALAAVLLVRSRMALQLRWRKWLTSELVWRWLTERRFYQLTVTGAEDLNPEYRIADDSYKATEPFVDFAIGLLNALLLAGTFLGILWTVGGGIDFSVASRAIHIPGYMVFCAAAYSFVCSLATVWLGRALVHAVDAKNAGEAQLRFEITRVRESAETIALIGGDEEEAKRIDETLSELVARWIDVIRRQANMTWVLNGNAVLSPVAPLLLGAPKYLAGSMSLGELMQATAAFVQVQIAFNWLVDNALRFAEWSASAQRVGELDMAFTDLDATISQASSQRIALGDSPDDKLRLVKLSISQQNGALLLAEAEIVVAPGEKVLVKGDSGTGKSTLIRAIAGLWPWGCGEILRPVGKSFAFMPQRPYMPLGTLRRIVTYPLSGDTPIRDEEIIEALEKCGLAHLSSRLEEEAQWSRTLSGGEQQRIAFARLLLTRPDIVIMDEATSALDELSQARMMSFLHDELRDATVLCVGHRPGLEAYHTREIGLHRKEGERAVHARERHYGLSGVGPLEFLLRWRAHRDVPLP
jgi:vitamin B12/bleomycin/antimicrobial peptide transport system ATP-binding/permease protein